MFIHQMDYKQKRNISISSTCSSHCGVKFPKVKQLPLRLCNVSTHHRVVSWAKPNMPRLTSVFKGHRWTKNKFICVHPSQKARGSRLLLAFIYTHQSNFWASESLVSRCEVTEPSLMLSSQTGQPGAAGIRGGWISSKVSTLIMWVWTLIKTLRSFSQHLHHFVK